MRTFVLVFTLLLTFAPVSRAEVFIYKNRIITKVTGGGSTSRSVISGWTLINDQGAVVQVLAYRAEKRFAVAPMRSIEFSTGQGQSGKQYTFFIQEDTWTDGNGLHVDTGGAKGKNTNLNVNGTAQNIPRVYTWSGRSLFLANNGTDNAFTETSGVFTFDKRSTATSDAEGDDINAATQRLADSLVERGFVEF